MVIPGRLGMVGSDGRVNYHGRRSGAIEPERGMMGMGAEKHPLLKRSICVAVAAERFLFFHFQIRQYRLQACPGTFLVGFP